MSINFGKYHALINPLPPRVVRAISDDHIREVESCLDKLAEILDGNFDWMLCGGLAIPITIGNFYRVHRDIDISVAESDLGNLTKTASKRDYGLFSRIMITKISPKLKLYLYKEVLTEEVIQNGYKNLRLVRLDVKDHPVRHTHLLDWFDVYIHHFENGYLVSNGIKLKIPINSNGCTYSTQSGRTIKVMPLEYILQFKQQGKGKVDRYDLGIIQTQHLYPSKLLQLHP